MEKYQEKAMKNLISALRSFDSDEELFQFLEDVCTIKELQDMAQRYETAILLSEGKNYQEIIAEAGTSTATISRVSKCLNYGAGGYRKAIENRKKA